jgi:hypothetical protein
VSQSLEETATKDRKTRDLPEQYLILVECAGEEEQQTLLARFHSEGLSCKALLS